MLTKRQRDALVFISAFKRNNHDKTPSYEAIAEALGIGCKSGVHRLVHGLQDRGYIAREPAGREIHLLKTVTGGHIPPPRNRVPIYRAGDHKLMGYLP